MFIRLDAIIGYPLNVAHSQIGEGYVILLKEMNCLTDLRNRFLCLEFIHHRLSSKNGIFIKILVLMKADN